MKTTKDFEKPLVGRAVTHPKHKVEDCNRISVYELKKGYFRGLAPHTDISLRITYTFRDKHIEDVIPLTNTPCYFGGVRWWFVCPSCKRRVGVLYKPYYAEYFRCRHCYDLTYLKRQIRGNFVEPLCRILDWNHKILRLLKGVGQKGFSKQEKIQGKKLMDKFLKLSSTTKTLKKL